jgi:hypothetical protein
MFMYILKEYKNFTRLFILSLNIHLNILPLNIQSYLVFFSFYYFTLFLFFKFCLMSIFLTFKMYV